jgi:transposase
MTEALVCVGIDVSQDRLDVHFEPSGRAFPAANDEGGIKLIASEIVALGRVDYVGVEASGGYETALVIGLAALGLPVVVLNAVQVRRFAGALNQRAKTDLLDAALIARFCAAVKPELRPLPDEKTRHLSDLMARRHQLVTMRAAEQQRLKQALSPKTKASLRRMIDLLSREIDGIDSEIDDDIRGSPIWKVKEDLLASVPGIGKITARTLLAEMPELGQLDRRTVASLSGVAPYTRQSGQWKGKSFTGGGRSPVKRALYMAAVSASRCNPVLAETYRRLVAAGKPKMVALIAVARRLVTIANAILRDQKPWLPA